METVPEREIYSEVAVTRISTFVGEEFMDLFFNRVTSGTTSILKTALTAVPLPVQIVKFVMPGALPVI